MRIGNRICRVSVERPHAKYIYILCSAACPRVWDAQSRKVREWFIGDKAHNIYLSSFATRRVAERLIIISGLKNWRVQVEYFLKWFDNILLKRLTICVARLIRNIVLAFLTLVCMKITFSAIFRKIICLKIPLSSTSYLKKITDSLIRNFNISAYIRRAKKKKKLV